VLDLQRHFGQANQDIEKILTSSERIASRGSRIENLEFEGEGEAAVAGDRVAPLVAPPSQRYPAESEGERRRATITRQPDLLAGE
jgi:DNA recombination protein RmuC